MAHPRYTTPGRSAALLVRMSHEERAQITAAATACGLTARDYVVGLVLADAARVIGNTPTDHPEELTRAS